MSDMVVNVIGGICLLLIVIAISGSLFQNAEFRGRCEAMGGYYENDVVPKCYREDGTRIFFRETK